tara:strand:+ start:5112 stop:6014 length:903 start_codon:yes stop_codon:yes gene_type:complete
MSDKKDNGLTITEKEWSSGHEKILIDWADKAMCYRWLHSRSHQRFSKVNTYFTIPVIIMSTLTGTANFAQDRVPEYYRGYFSMGVGFVNILAGIITTIQQFLKITELNEGHRVSSIHWDKFYRKIRVELSKPYDERQNVTDFLKNCTEEFDRLMETSPIIQNRIILLFQNTFSKTNDERKKIMFAKLKKPEICDSLESVEMSLFKDNSISKKHTDYKELLNNVILTINETTEDETIQLQYEVIDKFIETFKQEMLRIPNKEEIFNNVISEELKIDENIIDNYLNERNIDISFNDVFEDTL